MIRPTDLTEDQHGPRSEAELDLERVFDAAIQNAADSRAWPALVLWLPWSGMAPSQTSILRVSGRYRDAGWIVTLDLPDRSVLATIRRR
jgi:hypothetical protein